MAAGRGGRARERAAWGMFGAAGARHGRCTGASAVLQLPHCFYVLVHAVIGVSRRSDTISFHDESCTSWHGLASACTSHSSQQMQMRPRLRAAAALGMT